MKEKRKLFEAAKKLGFVDFLTQMSQATGKFESCEIDVYQDQQWVHLAGYNSTVITHKVKSLRYATSVFTKQRFCVVDTNTKEIWCDESCVRRGYVTVEEISPCGPQKQVVRIVPTTGF
ncbi:hypothetical protein ACPV5U_19110 [Vibrio mediterranei]